MKRKSVTRTVLASVAIGALFGSAQLMADCFSVRGKILNSLHDPALGSIFTGSDYIGGVSTAGVVALNGEKPIGKLKCALVGAAVGPGESPPGSPLPPLPDFTHTISCDDSVEEDGGVVHSQLTFDTTGNFTGFDGACTLFFTENSVPRSGSGKGVFDGTTGGGLTIEGTSDICTKSIDMRFTGEFCRD
jgi:hypothetical protein